MSDSTSSQAAVGAGAAEATTTTATSTTPAAPRSTVRRDHLRETEKRVQAKWEETKEFQVDAPSHSSSEEDPKFMCTFPYPYMNGRLHLGHAFTLSKAEFAAGYQRLQGKRVLFPFGFHCTGMPIQAAANKLKREIATGVHLQVIENLANGGKAAAVVEEEAEVVAAAAVEEEVAAAEASGAGASTTTSTSSSTEQKDPTKFSGKKSKAVAKGTAGNVMTQFEIMLKSGLRAEEIPAFQDPRHWLTYFPPLGEADLKSFGLHTDWRRSFITTDANPYYDSFIRWQFNTLRKKDKIGFGKRPTIYSPIDGQACADHDRASGEGVVPQEYTLIKIKLQAVPSTHKFASTSLQPLQEMLTTGGKQIYFVAATLRPETMYGQTNCYLFPEGEYGLYDTGNENNNEVFICSERSALNMSYQGLATTRGVPVCLGKYSGEELLGLPLSAPMAKYETVYTLPLLTISMKKGTGVVTSVPSDAPDDWAAYRDLQEKPKLREKYGLTEDMLKPDVVEIIDIPVATKIVTTGEEIILGRRSAVTICDVLKIKSQNDTAKLKEAKDATYMAGFYHGILLVGKYAGKKVSDAKPLVRADMIAEGTAAIYREPESTVMSRSGDECVVADLDQWYLKYGDAEWKGVVESWVRGKVFKSYSTSTQGAFEHTISWLSEWACSRSFGLGTKLPWDTQFVVESLSDSTIYMAYYAVAHLLHQGSLDGSTTGPAKIAHESMTDAVWDYIFLDTATFPADCGIPKETVDVLRNEFRYWYPMDLRVSGKDLIGNHLTMSLYNHAAIWDGVATTTAADGAGAGGAVASPRADRMPQGIFCNGHILVDGEKMSKSKGNFVMLCEAIDDKWGADATRFALADAGDTLDDANFETKKADNAILVLTTEETYIQDTLKDLNASTTTTAAVKFRKSTNPAATSGPSAAALAALEADTSLNFGDKVCLARVNKCVQLANTGYETMRYRDALQYSFYEMQLARDGYRDMCFKIGIPLHEDVIRRWIHVQTILMAPITPHWSEHIWTDFLGNTTSITRAAWPASSKPDEKILRIDSYLTANIHACRVSIMRKMQVKAAKAAKGVVPPARPTDVNIFVAADWPGWQRRPLEFISSLWDVTKHGEKNNGFPEDIVSEVRKFLDANPDLKSNMKKIMPLVSETISGMKGRTERSEALSMNVPFDEYALWNENLDYVKKALELPGNVTIYKTSDLLLTPGSATAKTLDPDNRCAAVVPMSPEYHAYAVVAAASTTATE